MTPTDVYDEDVIRQQLLRLAPIARLAVAAAVAQSLLGCYELLCAAAQRGDSGQLRSVVGAAWTRARGGESASTAEELYEVAELLVPHDDDPDWSTLDPIRQNAAAAAAYATHLSIASDVQDGVWCIRQLYEAADFMDQMSSAAESYVERNGQFSCRVEIAVRISLLLEAAESASDGDLHNWAEETDAVLRRWMTQ